MYVGFDATQIAFGFPFCTNFFLLLPRHLVLSAFNNNHAVAE